MDDDMTNDSQFPEADLARLADGSLSAAREAELRAELERSPELARAFGEQQRALTMLRSLDVPAPESLRTRIQEQTSAATAEQAAPSTAGRPPRSTPPRWRSRLRLWPALPAMAIAAVVVIVVLAGGGGASGPSLEQTTRLALASATMGAPTPDPSHPVDLRLAVDGIPFPNWARTVRWQTLGTRADTIGGRRIATVYYAGADGYQVGYSIVSGAPVPVNGGHTYVLQGVRYTLRNDGSARVVTWVRSGHTCVIAGRGVTDQTLLGLAKAA